MALILWWSGFLIFLDPPFIQIIHSISETSYSWTWWVDLVNIYICIYIRPCSIRSINHSLTPSRCIYIYICIHSSIHPATNHITSIHPSIHRSKNEKKIPPVFALPNPNQSEQPNFPHLISIPSHPIPSPHPIYPNTQNKPSLIDTLMLYFIIFSYIILYYITLITYMYNHRSRAHGIE